MPPLSELRRLEPTLAWQTDFIAHGGEVISVGPFQALFHPTALGVNYAAPLEPLGSVDTLADSVTRLRDLFAERNLTLHIEFNEPLFPQLPSLLEREGLTLHEREPLLLLTPSDFRPIANPEVGVRFLSAHDQEHDLVAYRSIFNEVLLEQPRSPSSEDIARLRREIEQGGGRGHALATLDGKPVGTGFIYSAEGVCEITRVGTIPAARRRAVAATVTSFMLADRFQNGDTLAWLTATGEAAQALYQKLGFQLVGDRLYYRDG